jgi:N utilization substance protein A
MPVREQIPRERFRQGDRVRAYILDVQQTPRGPQILLSRVHDEFLKSLFALEVPEIYERVIEIKAIAREPGERAKVAVYSSDDRIDPVGACVGIKGVRVQSIVRELSNERIDIVPWSSNSELFVTRALAPAQVVNIDVYDLEQKMTVAVEDEKLSLAIGRNGQNARLASKLTGWKVNILSETEYNEQKKKEAELLVPVGQLEGVGEKIRNRLIDANIASIQRLAEASVETLTKIEGLGPKTAETLLERAQEFVRLQEEEFAKRQAEEAEAAEAQAEAEAEEEAEETDSEMEAEVEPEMVEEKEEKLKVGDVFVEEESESDDDDVADADREAEDEDSNEDEEEDDEEDDEQEERVVLSAGEGDEEIAIAEDESSVEESEVSEDDK